MAEEAEVVVVHVDDILVYATGSRRWRSSSHSWAHRSRIGTLRSELLHAVWANASAATDQ